MAASKLKLAIEQGATFRKRITWETGSPLAPVNLTGFTARMQIRPDVTSPTILQALTTVDGRIVLGGVAGTIDLYLSDSTTTAYLWTDGVYDLELIAPGGDVTRLLYGTVSVSPEVTR